MNHESWKPFLLSPWHAVPQPIAVVWRQRARRNRGPGFIDCGEQRPQGEPGKGVPLWFVPLVEERLKGIATFLRNRGDLNFACLMFGVAAERIAATEGAEVASHELGIAAALARRHSRMRLAEALWRESLGEIPRIFAQARGWGSSCTIKGAIGKRRPIRSPLRDRQLRPSLSWLVAGS